MRVHHRLLKKRAIWREEIRTHCNLGTVGEQAILCVPAWRQNSRQFRMGLTQTSLARVVGPRYRRIRHCHGKLSQNQTTISLKNTRTAQYQAPRKSQSLQWARKKKRSIPVTLSERQKPPNSYARIFAAQKQKKAKENETKIVKNGDSKQRVEPEEHVNGHKHHSDHFGPWRPVDSGIPASYDSTLELAERTRKELQELDSQIEHHKFMAQNRHNNNPPR
ncbi:PREDICTED: uncharacterized protein LOC107339465 isoform X3 [Acropora digitifera]|uniref:uncharacterized protein LOC107339465 isoform X3 n=1 Tax=Acropora digitifera TaxID=70779 RepID=UPI00077A4BC6|nr:PREDICTED: uncharacterized protein LOC107339465 isoform X3 [Acropora digitifera]